MKNFLALDVETATQSRNTICQIGLVKVENGIICQTSSLLVQPPENKYSTWNSMIHGLSASTTQHEPDFADIWSIIKNEVCNQLIVAHNAAFDVDCLRQTLDFYQIKVPDFIYECTYQMTGNDLDCCCQAYNIGLNKHHDALCDAKACAELYLKILRNEQPDFSKVVKKKKQFSFNGHERISGELLKPDLANGNPNSPFYNKKVVFTGVLENMERREAAIKVKSLGADIDCGITKRTNYVITGLAPGPVKLQKIEKYQSAGCDIRIVYEEEFLQMLALND